MEKDLLAYNAGLPQTVKELHEFIIIGKEKLKAHKAKIQAINKINSAYAAKDAALHDAQDIAELVLYAEGRLGEMLRGVASPTASRAGRRQLPPNISHKESHQAQMIANNSEIVNEVINDAREHSEIPTSREVYRRVQEAKKPHVSFNSGENEWYTPPGIIEAACRVMGGIDCDPASSEKANEIVKAETYYTIHDNGLNQKWHGRVWMNPPYSQPEISQFSKEITRRFIEEEIDEACVLVNNATETEWFQTILIGCSACCFLRGRVKYLNSEGQKANTPLQGQVVIYFGDNVSRFLATFVEMGVVLTK